MQFTKGSISNIEFPAALWEELLSTCRRKLAGSYLPGETREKKVFGLLAGTLTGDILRISAVAPLLRNARSLPSRKAFMDEIMAQHAIASETPLEQRGWVADPEELQKILAKFREARFQLAGSYHMHRVPWQHDLERDTPTELDTILGKESRMFMFIISMVKPEAPVIRAFFEGKENLEVPIIRVK